jgi:hypothetical protein
MKQSVRFLALIPLTVATLVATPALAESSPPKLDCIQLAWGAPQPADIQQAMASGYYNYVGPITSSSVHYVYDSSGNPRVLYANGNVVPPFDYTRNVACHIP